tara:strand:- start:12 stop:299 length:288 start_codon:yes stop_codon:yes gene_type:complete
MNIEKKNLKFKADSLIEILETKGIKGFLNSTSGNDLTESIFNEELELQIFLPNSLNDNWENEEWNKFKAFGKSLVFDKTSSNIVNIIKNMGYEFE